MSQKPAKNENAEALIDSKTMKVPGGEFEEVSSPDRCLGFFVIQSGNAIQGIMRGSFEVDDRFNKGKKKRIYKIEVTSDDPAGKGPTLHMSGNSAVAEDWPDGCPAKVGELIGLDEKGFLQSLREMEEGREVWIACLGKDPPSEDYPQGAWKFRVMAKAKPKTEAKAAE